MGGRYGGGIKGKRSGKSQRQQQRSFLHALGRTTQLPNLVPYLTQSPTNPPSQSKPTLSTQA